MTAIEECANGHDMAVVGRAAKRGCKRCHADYQREYRKRIREGTHTATLIAEVAERHRLAREAKAAAEADNVQPLKAARGGGSFTPMVGPTGSPKWIEDRLTERLHGDYRAFGDDMWGEFADMLGLDEVAS